MLHWFLELLTHWRANLNTEIKIYYGADMPPLIMKAVTVPNTIL